MLRLLLITIISAFCWLPACNAADAEYVSEATQKLQIGGFFNQTASIEVSPMESSVDAGMDFDLLGEDVSSGSGRAIASWHAASNGSTVTLTIEAGNMVNTDTAGTQLEYLLIFDQDSGMSGDEFTISSGKTSTHELTSTTGTLDQGGTIRFRLPEDSAVASSEYPDGNYSATVTISIQGAM